MAPTGDEPVIGRNGQVIQQGNNGRDGQRGGGGGGGGGWNDRGMSRRFENGGDGFAGPPQGQVAEAPVAVVAPAGAGGDEASAMAAMFAASSEQWNQTQQQMAT